MKIIQNFKQVKLVDDPKILTKFFNSQYNFVEQELIECVKLHLQPGNTVLVHSGSWRFDFVASSIEPSYLRELDFKFSKSTYFVDYHKEDLLIKLVNKFSNAVFIDSPLTRYKTVIELTEFFKQFPTSVAAIRTDLMLYNRLTTTIDDLVEQLNGVTVGRFVVIKNT
jgi:hypothetical protein